MNPNYLDFEQPIAELEVKIEELQLVGSDNEINISEEIETLLADARSGALDCGVETREHPRVPPACWHLVCAHANLTRN